MIEKVEVYDLNGIHLFILDGKLIPDMAKPKDGDVPYVTVMDRKEYHENELVPAYSVDSVKGQRAGDTIVKKSEVIAGRHQCDAIGLPEQYAGGCP